MRIAFYIIYVNKILCLPFKFKKKKKMGVGGGSKEKEKINKRENRSVEYQDIKRNHTFSCDLNKFSYLS